LGEAAEAPLPPLRPPAVPLVAHDPYFSCWSFSDRLNASWPRHWTGSTQAMTAMIRVDGRAYVLMGSPTAGGATPMPQQSVEVLPTRTIYTFQGSGVHVTLTFLTPALPGDLDVLSRPVTYISFDVKSTDGKPHETAVYFDASGEWVVDKPEQQVVAEKLENDKGLAAVRMGSKDQKVLGRTGDNLRIEWGHLVVAAPVDGGKADFGELSRAAAIVADDSSARGAFGIEGELPKTADTQFPRAASDNWPVLAVRLNTGRVSDKETASAWLMIAYDDDYAIEHMKKRLRAWWKRDGMSTTDLIGAAAKDYPKLKEACAKFDEQLMADLRKAGGEKYARMCALAYRQAMAAHKLVASEDGKTPLYFSKENFSNGCIATVDITYPSAPMYLLLNPTLLKGMTTPILDYAQNSGRWKFPFAPHDLGQYPKANGQVYGGGERTERDQMPVEESGNMLILIGALSRIDGNADYAKGYWKTLEKWAAYLKEKGLDPENQLCTDDFAGHLAHNTNLSLKAIVALRAFAEVEDMVTGKAGSSSYHAVAKEMAEKWEKMAADGDHYKLTFDKAGTWSQKYNLVWDKLLKYDLFPKSIREKEIAFYKTKLNKYGLPLDSRKTYTKLDWIFWTATLADGDEDFRAVLEPWYTWANETTARVPMTDWYDTVTGKQSGFQARSVVGGLFIKMLEDEAVWKKYAKGTAK
jgi:hypothetical protein